MIKNIRVYGLEESILASSYPMLSEALTAEEFDYNIRCLKENLKYCSYLDNYVFTKNEKDWEKAKNVLSIANIEDLKIAYKHYRRVLKLGTAKEGSGHDCFLKGIRLQFDLTASHVFLLQFMRYHFQDTISSMSKMHRILRMDLEKCCNNKVRKETLIILKGIIEEYNENPSPEKFEEVVMNCPLGLELTSRVELNYLQLKTMCNQRDNHKMSEWHEFLNVLKFCPLFGELCLK